jgi:hypothetical protein
MEAMKSVRVESSLMTKELTILWDTDLGLTELGVLRARSKQDGWYFIILRDDVGHFLKVMEMDDSSTKEYKVFKSKVEHAYGIIQVTVVIDIAHYRWSIEIQ